MSSKLILAAAAVLVAGCAFGGALALTGEDEPKRPVVVEKKQSTPPGPEKHPDPEEVTDLYAPDGEVGVDH